MTIRINQKIKGYQVLGNEAKAAPAEKQPVAKTAVAALNTYRVTVAHPRDRKPCITDVAAHHFEAGRQVGGWVTFHDADGVWRPVRAYRFGHGGTSG